ncbi:MAG: cobalamin biosynthesis protein CbiG [Gammaproteobacteria bacterium]|nr:cobalamin biosynthesis protein CbiG [Gammaproteobacteria bacterium]MDH5802179.1 cobalamin biosynthesis protein CbiG [Gammaproteobacteria bacterium]
MTQTEPSQTHGETTVRVALVAITKHGAAQVAALAPSISEADVVVSAKFAETMNSIPNKVNVYEGALRDQIGPLFQDFDQIVFFVSLGAVIRLIAPHLKSKDEDPGVLVVDDAAQFVIPVLSGHVGGANAYAEKLAQILEATPVVTTASDVGKTIPVDILGRELGWKVEAPKINITRVSAHVVNEEAIAVVQEHGSRNWWTRPTPLPKNIHLFDSFDAVDLEQHKAVLWITERDIPEQLWQQLQERLVVYRPPQGQPS